MIKTIRAIASLNVLACTLLSGCVLVHETVGRNAEVRVGRPRQIAPPADMPSFAAPPLSPMALSRDIERLSSDDFQGRAPASEGEARTVSYISRAFAASGLEPGARQPDGQMGWLQTIPITRTTLTNAPDLQITKGRRSDTLRFGTDVLLWSRSADANPSLANAEIVFVGYGVVSRELGWNDYAGIDMRGRVALILANDPDFATGDDRGFGARAMSAPGDVALKLEEAARQGAVGALIIYEVEAAGAAWETLRERNAGAHYDLAPEGDAPSRLAVEGWIRQDAAQALIARAGFDLASLRALAQRPDFTPAPLGVTASATLETTSETRTSSNVIGILRGGQHTHDAVLFTSNWDSLGRCAAQAGDDICNGAMDNASGLAGLISLARRFGSERRRERSLVFIAFTGEEAGRLGSQYYVAHPAFAPERTVAAIQLEMLSANGPAKDIVAGGAGGGDLERLLGEAAAQQSRRVSHELQPAAGAFYRSDAYSLARAGIPALYAAPGYDLYLGGEERGRALAQTFFNDRSHRPDDEWNAEWDLSGATRDLVLLHDLGAQLADSNDWPNWRAGSEFRATRDQLRGR